MSARAPLSSTVRPHVRGQQQTQDVTWPGAEDSLAVPLGHNRVSLARSVRADGGIESPASWCLVLCGCCACLASSSFRRGAVLILGRREPLLVLWIHCHGKPEGSDLLVHGLGAVIVSRTLSATCGLTPRWRGRVIDKVPSSNAGVRAAQINR